MEKILIFILVICSLVSCSSSKDEHKKEVCMSSNELLTELKASTFNWQYFECTDEIYNKVNTNYFIISNVYKDNYNRDQKLTLQIEDSYRNGIVLYVFTNYREIFNWGSDILVNFDGNVSSYSYKRIDNEIGLYKINNITDFLEKFNKSKKVIIEIPTDVYGNWAFTFKN